MRASSASGQSGRVQPLQRRQRPPSALELEDPLPLGVQQPHLMRLQPASACRLHLPQNRSRERRSEPRQSRTWPSLERGKNSSPACLETRASPLEPREGQTRFWAPNRSRSQVPSRSQCWLGCRRRQSHMARLLEARWSLLQSFSSSSRSNLSCSHLLPQPLSLCSETLHHP